MNLSRSAGLRWGLVLALAATAVPVTACSAAGQTTGRGGDTPETVVTAFVDALNQEDPAAMARLAREDSDELTRGVQRRIDKCGGRRITVDTQRIEEVTPALRTAHITGTAGDHRPVRLRLTMTRSDERWYATLAESGGATGPTPFPTAGLRADAPANLTC